MATISKRPELKREVFTTRELEYFSKAELVTQTGYDSEEWWPGVLVKELVDNSLDACEQASAAPLINVSFGGGDLVVSDNGPGIPPDVIARILDFSTRTSDKAAYVSPTRGAQGNALKTILAIPYVLNEGSPENCINHNRPPMTKSAFGLALRRARKNLTDAERTVRGSVCWCYIGIRLKEEPPESQ
jgi:hypothetical protein